MQKILIFLVILAMGVSTSGQSVSPAEPQAPVAPDLTMVPPPDSRNLFNLGPTGLEGWMHVEWRHLVPGDIEPSPETIHTRQIYITRVAEGSPADGVVHVGDVILGIGDQPFDRDPRIALADAINESEKEENLGLLALLCWRPDESQQADAPTRGTGHAITLQLKLAVLGTYSDSAPYDCKKSALILDRAVNAMLAQEKSMAKLDLGYLALLATGEEKHVERARQYVLRAAGQASAPSVDAVRKAHAWNIGYRLILLCEYHLLTHDETVLPAIRNLAITVSMGQSVAGAWGHRMADPSYHINNGRLNGRLAGYADLNQPALTCFMGLALARRCGVDDPEVRDAIAKAAYYFRHYVGNGAIHYGWDSPLVFLQTNNGTSGSAALTFAMLGDRDAAAFYSRMCAGAHAKLEMGHTGTFFCTMWTGLGANLAGPETYAEFFKHWTWLRTLARKWDGGFVFQRPGGGFNYSNLSPEAAMILHYALPRRKLLITGCEQDAALWLTGAAAEEAALVWFIDYKGAGEKALLALLGHEIPMVRGHAAMELAARGSADIEALIGLLKGTRNEKIGASDVLTGMQEQAVPALAALLAVVQDEEEDFWVRSRAARAIAATGEAGLLHLPVLLKLLQQDRPGDPQRELERYVGRSALQMIKRASGNGVADKAAILPAAIRLMGHPHMDARTAGVRMVEDWTLADFHLVADSIIAVIRNDNPAFTTYCLDHARQAGLAILNRLDIEDGIQLAIDTIEPDIWGRKYRVTSSRGRLALLKEYGANVKPYIPKLRAVLGDRDEETIQAIEASTVHRELISLEDAVRRRVAE
jgi:hypothetical protein